MSNQGVPAAWTLARIRSVQRSQNGAQARIQVDLGNDDYDNNITVWTDWMPNSEAYPVVRGGYYTGVVVLVQVDEAGNFVGILAIRPVTNNAGSRAAASSG